MRELDWNAAIEAVSSERARSSLKVLHEGHERFLSTKSASQVYTTARLQDIATHQAPIAAIVACSDSRVAPEIIFDQPLGAVFASRVPGNVASDSAKWMLEIAVTELKVPLVIVLGHTGCLAVGQLVEGKIGGAGGSLRLDVQKAVHRARQKSPTDLYRQSVIENVGVTLDNLRHNSYPVQKAIEAKELGLLGGYYDMPTGRVHLLEGPGATR